MSTVQQSCPQCSRMLELPAESTGRLAKCPACQATFRIGEDAKPASDANSAPGPVSDTVSETVSETGPQPTAEDDPRTMPIVKKAIEDILPLSWSIFLANWKPSVGSCVIAALVFCLLVVLPVWGFSWVGGIIAVVGMMIMVPITLVVVAYLLVGLCRVHLAIVRHEPSPMSELRPPKDVVLRFLPSYGLLVVLFFCVMGIALGIIFALAFAGNMQAANVVGVLLVFAVTILATIGQWYLWAWLMVASDGKTTPMGSLAVSTEVTNQNKLMSFFLVIIAVVLSMLGSLACYVGHIVTTPITLVLFAVGYLLCTNQSVVDPNDYSSEADAVQPTVEEAPPESDAEETESATPKNEPSE